MSKRFVWCRRTAPQRKSITGTRPRPKAPPRARCADVWSCTFVHFASIRSEEATTIAQKVAGSRHGSAHGSGHSLIRPFKMQTGVCGNLPRIGRVVPSREVDLLPRLSVATLALITLFALPAIPALAYTSAGGVTYFGPYAALYASEAAANTTTTTVTTSSTGGTAFTVSKPWYSGSTGGTGTTGTGSATSGGSTQSGSTGSSTSPGSGTSSLSQQDAAFLQMVNGARAQDGLGALVDNPLLDRLALQKAQDIATYNYFAHYSPRLGWPIQQEEQAGFYALYMGAENIAEAGTVSRAFLDLRKSVV